MKIIEYHSNRLVVKNGEPFLKVSIPEDVKEVFVFSRETVVARCLPLEGATIEIPLYDFPAGVCGYLDEVFSFCAGGGDVFIYKIVEPEYSHMLGVCLLRKEKVDFSR